MKTNALTFFLLLSVLNSNAQVFESIGIKGGVSLANQTFSNQVTNYNFEYDYKIGAYTILTADLFKGKFLSLSTDFGFVQKGMQMDLEKSTNNIPEGTGEFETLKTTFNYLTFSPMVKGFKTFNNTTTYVLLGPRLDYRLNYESFFTQAYNGSNKFILGLNYGIGAEYKIKNFGILLEGMGQADLTPTLSVRNKESNSGSKVTGNAFIFITGLRYYLN